MKRIIACLLALIIFAVPVCALEEHVFSLGYTEGVTLYHYESITGEVLGMEAEEFKKYLTDNYIRLFGVDNNNEFVFEITSEETDFSKGIKDFKNIKETDIKHFADSMKFVSYNIETLGEVPYIVSQYPSDDSENSAVVSQYITVKQGQLYVITFTMAKGISDGNAERIRKIVSGITYIENDVPQNVSIWSVIGVAALAVLVFGVAVYILITVIKDVRKRKSEPDEVNV